MGRILIGNIKGPQGLQGPQGIQGPVGPQGPQGPLPPLVNHGLTTEAGIAALDAAMGKTFTDALSELNAKIAIISGITPQEQEVFPAPEGFGKDNSAIISFNVFAYNRWYNESTIAHGATWDVSASLGDDGLLIQSFGDSITQGIPFRAVLLHF